MMVCLPALWFATVPKRAREDGPRLIGLLNGGTFQGQEHRRAMPQIFRPRADALARIALASLAAPGLAPAVAILVLGYANGNRVLTGLGILVLLGYLSYYYYLCICPLITLSHFPVPPSCPSFPHTSLFYPPLLITSYLSPSSYHSLLPTSTSPPTITSLFYVTFEGANDLSQ